MGILGIVLAGLIFTMFTRSYVGQQPVDMTAKERSVPAPAAAADSPAEVQVQAEAQIETAASADPAVSTAAWEDIQTALANYPERLEDLDSQIDEMRKNQVDSNLYSVKSAARTEQRIWEREMETVLALLSDNLDGGQAESLDKEQKEWTQKRDNLAMEAARKTSGGSMESVEYIASIASSTRQRVYDLVSRYQEIGRESP